MEASRRWNPGSANAALAQKALVLSQANNSSTVPERVLVIRFTTPPASFGSANRERKFRSVTLLPQLFGPTKRMKSLFEKSNVVPSLKVADEIHAPTGLALLVWLTLRS